MTNLEEEVEKLNQRNARVEADKAWEISGTRKGLIALITYFAACLFLYLIKVPDFYLAALVPVGGYLLSTVTLRSAKAWWIGKFLNQ
ncbi:MAG TPA: hypothetical protein VGB97_00430 [Candidatus Paceibacterota bacterium]|jgi:hypothetical protein